MVFFIAINIYLVEGILGLSVRKDALYYLKQSQVLSVVCFVFFVFIAYEYLIKCKNASMLECVKSIHNGLIKIYLSQLTFLTALILVVTMNVMLYCYVACLYVGVNLPSFLYHILLNNFLNITLVSLLGVGLGALCALYLKRFSAYLMIILVTIIISPIFDFIPYILFMGFDVNIYPIRDLFNILPPNLNWVAEALYGLSIEPYRWNLTVFWISVIFPLILLKLNNRKNRRIEFLCLLLFGFAIFNFYLYMHPGSIVRKDYNPNNYTAYDELYYLNDVQKEENAGFEVISYDMEINIGRQLENNVKIMLDERESLKNYKFTLYRNYDIKRVTGKKGQELEFKQEGDYFEIYNPSGARLEEVSVLYSGFSPIFYSNCQAVLLPGCFPYYPIEGYRKIYLKEQSDFLPIIRDYNVKFRVSVKAYEKILCNLDKKDGAFVGEAQSVSLVGGFVNENRYGNTVFCGLPLEQINTDNLLRINEVIASYSNLFPGLESANIKGIKIFQSTATISSKLTDNGIVSFRDHIFMYNLDERNIVQGIIQAYIPNNIDKLKAKEIFFIYIFHKERVQNNPRDDYRRLFLEKIDKLGEEYVLKKTYEFLTNEEDIRSSYEFINGLE